MAGTPLSFERHAIQLHQVLDTRTSSDGTSGYPLRHDFGV
jgi:cyclopropane-fatty-acyl-phospholipid synthase